MHFGRAGVDLALGVDAKMHRAAGRAAVGDLQRGDLDDPVPELGVEPRGLRVDDDLAHAGGGGSARAAIRAVADGVAGE